MRQSAPWSGRATDQSHRLHAAPRIERARTRARSTLRPGLADEPPGALSPSTAATLRIVVHALLPQHVDTAPYEEQLAFLAENVSGQQAFCERFARQLERRARRRGHGPITLLDRNQVRHMLIPPLRALSTATGAGARLNRLVRRRSWWLFREAVVKPVLSQYARTDAWCDAGYPEAPGRPRSRAPAYAQPAPIPPPTP